MFPVLPLFCTRLCPRSHFTRSCRSLSRVAFSCRGCSGSTCWCWSCSAASARLSEEATGSTALDERAWEQCSGNASRTCASWPGARPRRGGASPPLLHIDGGRSPLHQC